MKMKTKYSVYKGKDKRPSMNTELNQMNLAK